jgi:hypothetical protein
MPSPTSRYRDVGVATYTRPDGRKIPYLLRRFVPDPAGVVVLAQHTVVAKDRIDNVTAKYLGDPEQFWRVCDANLATVPEELTAESEIGRRLVIPMPQKG